MTKQNDDTDTVVELYTRAGGPDVWNHQRRTLDALDRLEQEGVVDEVSHDVWAETVPLAGRMSETTFHRRTVERVREFEDWAIRRDRHVSLPFDREERSSEFTGEHHHLLRVPAVCLAVYENGDLVGVFPRQEHGETVTVDDLVETLRNETVPEVGSVGPVQATGSGSDAN
jgi:hypothetical protein